MMKMRRIFWKLFFSFWLGNTLVLAAVTVFVVATVESSHIRERHRQVYETIASTIIEEYEAGANLQPKLWQRLLRHNREFREFKHHFAMRIVDTNENEIINIRFRKAQVELEKEKPVVFTLFSDSNTEYRVETYKRPTPPFIRDAMRRFNVLQIIAVLFSSGIVAGLLSWHLSRPLEALRQFSKTYSGSQADVDIGAALLARGDEIGDLARELHEMSARVQRNFSNQKELLHYVSHELRAPLARLQTIAGLAEQRVPEAADFVAKIHHECHNINALIEHILQYSRLEHVALVPSKVVLDDLMQSVVSSVKTRYPQAIIQSTVGADVQSADVVVDEDRMYHALENIVQNACKYGAKNEPIGFVAKKEGDNLILCVENNVDDANIQPLSPEALVQIFEPFYRGGNKMHTDGHGLGLSIARRVIEQHGGIIKAQNREAGGLRIVISLPLAEIIKD